MIISVPNKISQSFKRKLRADSEELYQSNGMREIDRKVFIENVKTGQKTLYIVFQHYTRIMFRKQVRVAGSKRRAARWEGSGHVVIKVHLLSSDYSGLYL